MISDLDVAMKAAENRKHVTRVPRPHLAQEFIDTGQIEHCESITRNLTEHAKMCAEGKTKFPTALEWWRSKKGRAEVAAAVTV